MDVIPTALGKGLPRQLPETISPDRETELLAILRSQTHNRKGQRGGNGTRLAHLVELGAERESRSGTIAPVAGHPVLEGRSREGKQIPLAIEGQI